MKRRTSYTLSEEAKRLLAELAKQYGISQTAMLEVLIRERAKQDNVK
jgi:replication initiation and membrane attachment protein DnaB